MFGAPITIHAPQTLLTALHIGLLSSYPLSSSITPNAENLRQLVTLESRAEVDVVKWSYGGMVVEIQIKQKRARQSRTLQQY
jgi:GPI biosynthesis protein family Pig-F